MILTVQELIDRLEMIEMKDVSEVIIESPTNLFIHTKDISIEIEIPNE